MARLEQRGRGAEPRIGGWAGWAWTGPGRSPRREHAANGWMPAATGTRRVRRGGPTTGPGELSFEARSLTADKRTDSGGVLRADTGKTVSQKDPILGPIVSRRTGYTKGTVFGPPERASDECGTRVAEVSFWRSFSLRDTNNFRGRRVSGSRHRRPRVGEDGIFEP